MVIKIIVDICCVFLILVGTWFEVNMISGIKYALYYNNHIDELKQFFIEEDDRRGVAHQDFSEEKVKESIKHVTKVNIINGVLGIICLIVGIKFLFFM